MHLTGTRTIMNFQYIRSIPKAAEIVAEWPLPPALAEMKRLRDIEVRDIVTGRSGKFLLIVGPCSADNEDAICDYVSRLRKVQDETADRLVIVPRIYTNKPRTTGEGYKGILHQPDPEKAPDMVAGIIALRRMHLRALAESGLPAADEMLYPENHTYLEDMLAYVAVGARSVENQQHRLTASGLDIPVGMKNPTSGDLSVMLNSIQAAQGSHTFIYQGFEVRTAGIPWRTRCSGVRWTATARPSPTTITRTCSGCTAFTSSAGCGIRWSWSTSTIPTRTRIPDSSRASRWRSCTAAGWHPTCGRWCGDS